MFSISDLLPPVESLSAINYRSKELRVKSGKQLWKKLQFTDKNTNEIRTVQKIHRKKGQTGSDHPERECKDNIYMTVMFNRLRLLVETLWNELHASQEEQQRFASLHYYPETISNYNILFKEIQILCRRRDLQEKITFLIEQRESLTTRINYLSRMKIFNGRSGAVQNNAFAELANQCQDLRIKTIKLVSAVVKWRKLLKMPAPVIWKDCNYMSKMSNDISFHPQLRKILLKCGIDCCDNPLLLPTGVRSSFPNHFSCKPFPELLRTITSSSSSISVRDTIAPDRLKPSAAILLEERSRNPIPINRMKSEIRNIYTYPSHVYQKPPQTWEEIAVEEVSVYLKLSRLQVPMAVIHACDALIKSEEKILHEGAVRVTLLRKCLSVLVIKKFLQSRSGIANSSLRAVQTFKKSSIRCNSARSLLDRLCGQSNRIQQHNLPTDSSSDDDGLGDPDFDLQSVTTASDWS